MVVLLTTIMGTGFTSCGGDDDQGNIIPENPTTPITPEEPSKEDDMSPEDRKEYLEKVALEFMDLVPASDFREISELEMYINDTYGEDYDWDNVKKWGEDIFDALKQATGIQTTKSETKSWGDYVYKYNDFFTNYKALLMASNFTGHFIARNGRWELEKASDMQFIFTDKQGKQCVLKSKTSGNIKKVHVLNREDWKDYDIYYETNYSYIRNDYYDRTECTIGIPETIEVELTQNGNQVVKTTVHLDINNIVGEEFDLSKSNISSNILIELNNGYKFDFSNITYTANTKASVSFVMSKNGKSLISIGTFSDINDMPSVNVSEFSNVLFEADNYNFDDANAKNGFVKVDIIGKVQIQGVVSDLRKYVNCLINADEYDYNANVFKSYINQANAITDMYVFYDGKNTKQAEVRLEAFSTGYNYRGISYWNCEPVIYFFDGTSYSTFKAFINENDFARSFDTFKRLVNKYADLIDERIKW